MVETKVIKKAILLLVAVSLLSPQAFAWKYSWKSIPINGERTGVTAPTADNVDEAIGVFERGKYIAPNGRKFRKGSTPAAARLMLDAQPAMADVKVVVGYSTEVMTRYRPECPLSNWLVDEMKCAAEQHFGRKVDIAITNFGGIRVDMPQGEVIVDDIMSMFPFKNYLCYLALKGSDVRYLFEQMAANGIQAVSGVKLVIENNKLKSLEIGGEALDDNKIYGLATIDFLLDGGDDVYAARNAQELIMSELLIYDVVRAYIARLTAEGKNIEYKTDGRVTVL